MSSLQLIQIGDTSMKTQIMRNASHLLPPPGGEVVRDLLDKYDDLLASYNALQDAVAWERETSRFWEFVKTHTLIANDEALESMFAARAEVDRMLEEKWN